MVQTSLTTWLKRPATIIKHDASDIDLGANGSAEHHDNGVNTEELRRTIPELHQDPRFKTKDDQSDGKFTLKRADDQKIVPSSKSQLPPNVKLCSITSETLQSFRRLNALMLPVPYTDRFYDEILHDPVAASVSLVALWYDSVPESQPPQTSKPRVVAGIRCRLLQSSPSASVKPMNNGNTNGEMSDDASPSLYISTIVTLAPFRSLGLARALLQCVLSRAIDEYEVKTVSAHVWEANIEARQWYAKQGFREVSFEKDYYRRLKPGGAWVVERPIGISDLLGEQKLLHQFPPEGTQERPG